jgi:hypothetical protein
MFAGIKHSTYTEENTCKGSVKPGGMRRIGDNWNVVSEELPKLIIVLNYSSTCEITKTMVLDFKDKASKREEIYVPYNGPLLRQNHHQIACLGKKLTV